MLLPLSYADIDCLNVWDHLGHPGGDHERIIVRLVHDDVEELTRRIGRIDSAQARCTHETDRQFLLAIIEASFGTVVPFNNIVREIFAKECSRHIPSLRPEVTFPPRERSLHLAAARRSGWRRAPLDRSIV